MIWCQGEIALKFSLSLVKFQKRIVGNFLIALAQVLPMWQSQYYGYDVAALRGSQDECHVILSDNVKSSPCVIRLLYPPSFSQGLNETAFFQASSLLEQTSALVSEPQE